MINLHSSFRLIIYWCSKLVTLPYNLLLQRNAREALGIDLTDQIAIIDEADSRPLYCPCLSIHRVLDLIPTLLSLSTTRLPQSILVTSFLQVCTYVSKFRNRLGPANLLHLKRLIVFLDALKQHVLEWKESRTCRPTGERKTMPGIMEKVEVITPAQLIERLGRKVLGINVLEIERYLKTSKVWIFFMLYYSVKLDCCSWIEGCEKDFWVLWQRGGEKRR